MNKKVSIVIPSHNRKKLLSKCLNSVGTQDYLHKEILVIDDGSTDGTLSFIKEHFPEIKIIYNLKSLGPAFAKNQGIVNSCGQYIYFLDSDSELIFKDTISNMVKVMESNEDIGILGGILELDAQGNIRRVYGQKTTYDGRSCAISLEKGVPDLSEEVLAECDYVPTCNCFVRRDILFKIGGFDPYYIYMGEDKELGIKIRNLGYKAFFGFKVACLHRYDETVKFDRRFMYLKNKLRFAIKNKGVSFFFIIPILDFYFFFVYYPFLFILRGVFPDLKIVRIYKNRVNPNLKPPGARWILFSVCYFVKVYLLNLIELPHILRCRNVDFLSREKLETYKSSGRGIKICLKK